MRPMTMTSQFADMTSLSNFFDSILFLLSQEFRCSAVRNKFGVAMCISQGIQLFKSTPRFTRSINICLSVFSG